MPTPSHAPSRFVVTIGIVVRSFLVIAECLNFRRSIRVSVHLSCISCPENCKEDCHLIGFVDFLELFLGVFFAVRVFVRMPFQRCLLVPDIEAASRC